jgi:chemotaxis signal transduction protein
MHAEDLSQVVGGIGVIFDSEPQFKAMLSDSLPVGQGVFGVLYDEHQTLISTTREDWVAGHSLMVDLQHIQRHGTGIIDCQDGRYAVGISEVSGYREYMGRHRVYGAIFCRIGEREVNNSQSAKKDIQIVNNFGTSDNIIEIATFSVGDQLFGLRTEYIIEAVDVSHMIRIPVPDSFLHGYLKYQNKPVPVLNLSRYLATDLRRTTQAVIAEYDKIRFAILVDELGSIPQVPTSLIVPIELHREDHLIDCLVSRPSQEGHDLLMIISPNRIRQLMATGKVTLEALEQVHFQQPNALGTEST